MRAARAGGKAAGIQPGAPEQGCEWLALGFNVISWSVDAAVYRRALVAEVAALREQIGGR